MFAKDHTGYSVKVTYGEFPYKRKVIHAESEVELSKSLQKFLGFLMKNTEGE